jgi:hypothetical protein
VAQRRSIRPKLTLPVRSNACQDSYPSFTFSRGWALIAKTVTGEIMPQYLVAIHHPDDYDPSVEDEAMGRDIDVLNEEMIAAGIRVFVGGLHPVKSAKSLRAQPGGKVLITDGPYLETKEHIGGFWVLEATDMNEALEWGRKAVVACRAPVEVRQFHSL